MNEESLFSLIKSDIDRRSREKRKAGLFDVMSSSTLKLIICFRICSCIKKSIALLPLYLFFYLLHKHYEHKLGIILPIGTKIGPGLHIMHYSGIVINERSVIGKNFTIMQCSTIGHIRGRGTPVIGDNVVVACNCSVIGDVNIGNNVMVGAGSVVCKNIESGATVVGNPAKIVNLKGCENVQLYITNQKLGFK